ncbi:short chain dehydrogenase [Pseudomonas sp. AFG_SD02_1510_Pfu_092]|nr:short chain dehydrogenase [Pseudomonas sp. AFG_SD02_1510_Pfu_092]RCL28515.1 short chain dehydrogenase [Pseudomonas sp. AFG_SD02_1510_Pfu_092]
MIDPATGMKPGERYQVENLERVHQFPGFFLDGKYYLGPELLTALGWLEGQRFIYDALDATGEPVFPGRAAGDIKDLTLILVDGTRLQLSRIDAEAAASTADADRAAQPAGRHKRPNRPGVLSVAAMLLLGGCAFALLRRARR